MILNEVLELYKKEKTIDSYGQTYYQLVLENSFYGNIQHINDNIFTFSIDGINNTGEHYILWTNIGNLTRNDLNKIIKDTSNTDYIITDIQIYFNHVEAIMKLYID